MAVVKCKECGGEVSTKAKACPKCGAKPSKNVGVLGIIMALAVGVFVYQCSSGIQGASKRLEAAEVAKSPEQLAAEARERKADEARLDAAIEMVRFVKQHAKDPASIAFVQIGVNEKGDLVCATYRGKNSFNVTVPGAAVIHQRSVSDSPADWKKYCSKATGLYDYTHAG